MGQGGGTTMHHHLSRISASLPNPSTSLVYTTKKTEPWNRIHKKHPKWLQVWPRPGMILDLIGVWLGCLIDLGIKLWGECNSLGTGPMFVRPCAKGRARLRVWPPCFPLYRPCPPAWSIAASAKWLDSPSFTIALLTSYMQMMFFILACFLPPQLTQVM